MNQIGMEKTIAASPGALLGAELSRRQTRNPRFSRRAFARHLGLSSGQLSEILSGKRKIGPKLADRIADRIFPDLDGRARWTSLVREDKKKREGTRKLSLLARVETASIEYRELAAEELEIISAWYHFAILNLVETDDFKPSSTRIADRLGVPVREVRAAIARLMKLGLLREENGTWARTSVKLTTTQDMPSEALRAAHKRNLDLAGLSLEAVPVERRDYSSVCVPFSPERMAEAKRLIANFRRSFAELVARGPKTEVYHLNVAFFPLTQRSQ